MTAETITCPTHGESQFAFVCKHLIAHPAQKWHCGYPEEDEPWRDAWCSACNEAFEREGEWNENNEGEADIGMLCGHCYEDGIAQSVTCMDDATGSAWVQFLQTQCEVQRVKQQAMVDNWRLNDYPRWDYYQETAQLVFSGGEQADLVADVEFVGTLSTASHTWMWSWANFSLLEPVRSRIAAVRGFGEEHDYPLLTVPKWKADAGDGWHMTAVALHVLGGLGVYRAPSDNGFIFMVVMSAQLRT
ncbi:hypothetical protein SAMN05518865_10119 [Duganella sp. CF458]|uniref:DUF6882 domain-containing protein n=1 Tax=Duganella sp. CF458 TaxID=1884368 RepID=UPI0008E35AE4|nr:DUF6882 domain-containing protein [Duganella sp. CF458]SFF50655.1 hypothetical protein SAMN05518865_10119 [Duganella sp. CF458]